LKYVTTIGEREYTVDIIDEHQISIDGKNYDVDFNSIFDQPVYSLLLNGRSFEAYVYPSERIWQVLLVGRLYPALVEDEREKRLRIAAADTVGERDEFHLKAPMPGMVVSIPVNEGAEIEKGDVLVILESMKMQNELKSPRAGKVARLRVKKGDHVEQQQTMLSIV